MVCPITWSKMIFYILNNLVSKTWRFNWPCYAVVKLVDKIIECFNNNRYGLGIIIDLPKAFDSVDYSTKKKKGKKKKKKELYGITDRNHGWVKSYVSNRRQFIQIESYKTSTNGLFHSHSIPFTPIYTIYIKKTKDLFFLHGVTNLLCYEVKTDGRKHFYKHDYILKKSFIFVAYLL